MSLPSSLTSRRRTARLLFHPSTPLLPFLRSSFVHPFLKPCAHFIHLPHRPSRLAAHRPHCTATTPADPPAAPAPSPAAPPALRSPYDLVHFRRSRFVAHLNERARRTTLPPSVLPDAPSRLDLALTSAGLAHEDRVLSHLLSLVSARLNLPPSDALVTIPPGRDRYDRTAAAIAARVPLIRAAALRDPVFAGVADVLLLASADPFASPAQRARARDGAYVVCEVKLASTCTADFALQAAAYAAMLAAIQGEPRVPSADWAYVWVGSPERPPNQLSLRSLMYLLDRTRMDFASFLNEFRDEDMPEPDGPLHVLSPWKDCAQQLLEEKDSLRLVAGIRRAQAAQIEQILGITTLEGFADLDDDALESAIQEHSWPPSFRSVHRQAKMQLQTRRNGGKPTAFELIGSGPEPPLPPESIADMFFDMEGFPLMEHGGLEYLYGLDQGDGVDFKFWWAHSREEEELAFVHLMRRIQSVVEGEQKAGRRRPHIFHYGHYEVTALRRVALRAVSPEGLEAGIILDKLLLDDVFVDIYKVVTSAFVIGEPSYSIKKVEKLVGISRDEDDLADAESSVGMYYEWRRKFYFEDVLNTTGDSSHLHPILEEILRYNQQDCQSLRKVVCWLREKLPQAENLQQTDAVSHSGCVPGSSVESDANGNKAEEITPGACGPTLEHKLADSIAIQRSLELSQILLQVGDIGLSLNERSTFAHLLQYYVRESIPSRMQFSDRIRQASGPNYTKLAEDDQCITGVKLVTDRLEGEKTKKKVFEYVFPKAQLSMLASGSSAAFIVPRKTTQVMSEEKQLTDIACFVTIKGLNQGPKPELGSLTVSVGRSPDFVPPPFGVLVSSEDLKVCNAPLRQGLLRTAERLIKNKPDAKLALPLAFLKRISIDEEPFHKSMSEQFQDRDMRKETVTEFLASRSQSCVFVIQGPPGSGKTSLSSAIISDLVMNHKKAVAVSSNSHAAIDNILSCAIRAGCDSRTVWKIGTKSTNANTHGFRANLRDLKVVPFQQNENTNDTSPEYSTTSPKTGRTRKAKACGALVGATCYQLSRVDSESLVDFLFVDEASQVPIPNFLSMSTVAKYAVLVGDQQQLEMPIKGAHPEVLEQSCLSYIVGEGVATVPLSRGIFLEKSYRMNPDICRFISESFYDHALSPAFNCMENKLELDRPKSMKSGLLAAGHGIAFVPCNGYTEDESGKPSEISYGRWHRPAEAQVIAKVIDELLGVRCTVNGSSRAITIEDMLVVAPYNAQVRALKEILPEGVRVGTVDKFQGQEAPIALISTCASKISDGLEDISYSTLPGEVVAGRMATLTYPVSQREHRGLRFSLRKNRLNVAISRAQCLAIITGEAEVFSSMRMASLDDVEVAALYEHLVHYGST